MGPMPSPSPRPTSVPTQISPRKPSSPRPVHVVSARELAVKYAGLAPARRGFAFTAAMLLVLAAVVLGTMGWPPALHVFFLQWPLSAILIATALTECVAVAVSLADSRPR